MSSKTHTARSQVSSIEGAADGKQSRGLSNEVSSGVTPGCRPPGPSGVWTDGSPLSRHCLLLSHKCLTVLKKTLSPMSGTLFRVVSVEKGSVQTLSEQISVCLTPGTGSRIDPTPTAPWVQKAALDLNFTPAHTPSPSLL